MTNSEATTDTRPRITPTENGPYQVENVEHLTNQHGDLKTRPKIFLCRCGGSKTKPYCDNSHKKNGFSDAKLDGRPADRRDNYEGAEVTIHDNRGICAHIGRCTDGLPAVFESKRKPWIDADAATKEEIVATIRQCPSGALSYSLNQVEYRDREGDPAIFVSPDGPYFVSGGPELANTEQGEGASGEHYALCRCGGSKNKPFCDGTHWYIKFRDERN